MLKADSRRRAVPALVLIAFLGFSASAGAERYLTTVEAQEICFPQADRFDSQVVRFSKSQVKAIERKSGLKVRNRGNRVYLASKEDGLVGVMIVDQVFGKHELIDYAVAVSPSGKVIQIEILQYRESHGREIRNENWRGQFAGKTADSALKLNDDIYNISGATISCRQVTEGVKRVLATFEIAVRPRLKADGILK